MSMSSSFSSLLIGNACSTNLQPFKRFELPTMISEKRFPTFSFSSSSPGGWEFNFCGEEFLENSCKSISDSFSTSPSPRYSESKSSDSAFSWFQGISWCLSTSVNASLGEGVLIRGVWGGGVVEGWKLSPVEVRAAQNQSHQLSCLLL